MRAISSVRMTVLPRPAPPNRPALPPRTNGVSRSMTLMPVSNSSVLVDRSSTVGASRWIGQYSSASTGPRPSIGSPSRLNTRPSVALPTGTVTGAPVSTHSLPRTRPSVLPRATQRTRPPPRCCCTSPVRLIFDALVLGRRSSRRCRSPAGWSSSNSASNVEPMTCVTWPMFFAVAVAVARAVAM